MTKSDRPVNEFESRVDNSSSTVDELRARNDILEHTVKGLEDYIKQLAHDLKTPLTPLVGASELLASSINELPWSNLAQSIKLSAENLLRMVDELLDLERCDSGTLPLNYSRFDPVKPVVEETKKVEAALPQSRATIALNSPPTPIFVWADEMRLRQIIAILLINALRFSPNGGKVIVSIIPGGTATGFTVEDAGTPIGTEDLAYIFEPYQSFNGHGRRFGNNSLTLARRLVELQGGSIGVRNAAKLGNTFWFDLPVEKSAV